MPKPILYSLDLSPPCRAVLMTADVIGLELDVRETNLLKGAHTSEEYLKMNPMHTIPVLKDNNFVVWDSHAILGYLANKYAKNDSLYPKDPEKRALVDQYLYFETGTLFPRLRNITTPVILHGETSISEQKLDALKEAFGWLDRMLDGKKWLVGDSYTLADISCVSSVSNTSTLVPMDKYPNVTAWLERCENQIPSYKKYNLPGKTGLDALLRSKLA